MNKPTLFIGSSTEGKRVAEEVHSLLEDVAEVKIWDQETFFPGEHPLESLRREVLRADYALLIVTPDDQIQRRGQGGYTARDNVLFELGLFMGALGPGRSFYLVITDKRDGEVREVLLPSDLTGITRLQAVLEQGGSTGLAVRRASTELKRAIERGAASIHITLLPSTSLAIGYFNNFVLQVCRKLAETKDFRVGEQVLDLSRDIYDFYIVLPNRGADASHEGFQRFVRKRDLRKIEIEGSAKSRTFPFYVDSVVREGRISLFDYPTTLRAAREAILLAIPRGATEAEIEELERREISNFEKTLRRLLSDPSAADFRDNVRIVYVNELERYQV